jgi:RNA polymerase sigma-70 factor (ECF subfamily)
MAVSPRYEPGPTIEELFREHHARVQTICRSLLDDPADAEDATQQVFLAAFRALAGGTVPRRPEAWLAAIARNECRGRSRSRPAVAPLGADVASPDGDPSALALQRTEVAAVWEAIAELPATQRQAILLREVRGLSYEELADDMQLTRPSIRSLLSRARQAIRARLGDGWAALGGASWLESLTRLFAGGSTPAAIATKTAAVGLGAAAVTGGAIVAPDLKPHRHPDRIAAAVVHPRREVVAHLHLKPADRADPVDSATSAPASPVSSSALVVAARVIHHERRESAASVSRVHRTPVVSSRRRHPFAAATTQTFVSDDEDAQPAALPPQSPAPTPGPTSPDAQGASAAGLSAHHSDSGGDSGSGNDWRTASPVATESLAPTAATPPVESGQGLGEPTDGGATSEPSGGPAQTMSALQSGAPAPDGSARWSDGSHQSDRSEGD